MSEDLDEVKGYPRLVYTVKLGYDMMTVRAETGKEILEGAAELADVAGGLADAGVAIKNAFGVVQAEPKGKEEAPSAGTKQGRTYSRTTKPGATRKPTQASSSDGDVCNCGKPWKDLDGGVDKNGKPYRYRYYNTCGNRDCKPWGDPS